MREQDWASAPLAKRLAWASRVAEGLEIDKTHERALGGQLDRLMDEARGVAQRANSERRAEAPMTAWRAAALPAADSTLIPMSGSRPAADFHEVLAREARRVSRRHAAKPRLKLYPAAKKMLWRLIAASVIVGALAVYRGNDKIRRATDDAVMRIAVSTGLYGTFRPAIETFQQARDAFAQVGQALR